MFDSPPPPGLAGICAPDESTSSTAAIGESAQIRRKRAESQPTPGLADARIAALVDLMTGHRVEATFHALADPTRRAMLERLLEGEKRAAQLVRGFAVSATAAAKHLAVLEEAGMVRSRRIGRARIVALDGDPIGEAALWLGRWRAFASPRLSRIAVMIDNAMRLG